MPFGVYEAILAYEGQKVVYAVGRIERLTFTTQTMAMAEGSFLEFQTLIAIHYQVAFKSFFTHQRVAGVYMAAWTADRPRCTWLQGPSLKIKNSNEYKA